MKYNKFPDDYYLHGQIVFRDKLLFLLTKVVPHIGSFTGESYFAVLYDPFEEKFFGHTCTHQLKDSQTLLVNNELIPIFGTRGYSSHFSLYIGRDAENPLLIQMNRLRTTENLDVSDLFFSPISGKYIKLQNVKYLGNFLTNYNSYYERNFFVFLTKTRLTLLENILDVDIREQYYRLKDKLPIKDSVCIIQPKISNSPKILTLDLDADNIFKHPTEPLLIAYNYQQYIIIDLDV